ncbi:hypothetical protein SLS60_011052 [Paraconiothyrium brasiliense]|uniref:Uncharacterized protein n=1 Tax=Paraconiothyrium brasiliense TaxID=300254 RepID=A0ABR3QKF7_9PLEO
MEPEARAKRRRVFLAYRKIFTGKLAATRKKKAICAIIQKHDWLSYQKYVGISDRNEVVRILRGLLINRIFESDELASKEFPNLDPPQHPQLAKRDKVRNVVVEGPEKNSMSLEGSVKIKHEEASEGVPNVIGDAAVELTKWLGVLKTHMYEIPHDCISTEGQASLEDIAPTVAQLRHTAVHRLRLTLDQFLDQIHCARILAELLQDFENVPKLQALYVKVEVHAREMKQNLGAIRREVNSALLRIQWERDALLQREQGLMSYVAQQKINIPVAAGQSLDESVNVLFATQKLHMVGEEHGVVKHNENATYTDYGVMIEEGDIESDEDQLQAELD